MSNLSELDEWREKAKSKMPGGGDGSGYGGDMDQRVKDIENQMTDVRVSLGKIEGRLEDMPTKDWMNTRLIWVVGAFLAITALVQLVIDQIGKSPPLG